MEWALFGVVAIATIVVAGVFGKKLGIATPILLILFGVAYSYIPGAPVDFPHEWILLGFLPLILYSAALNVPVMDFRRNFTSISALSVALVVVTALVTGYILYLIFPDLSLAAGIAIGAVIGPTDAVAATSLAKRLGLPARLVAILEGEGLVNDVTALVLLRSAIAATAAAVTFWEVVVDFAFAVALALLIGLIVGIVTVYVRSKLTDPLLDTAISFVVPFLAFLPAEYFHASGVLAVVVAGLYSGHNGARRFTAQARISERLNWRTLQFVLENGVFLLMGIEISKIVGDVHEDELSADQAVYIGLLMTLVVIVVRFLFVAPLIPLLRAQTQRAEARHSRLSRLLERFRGGADNRGSSRRDRAAKAIERKRVDIEQIRQEGLGWKGGLIISWAGMRGVVTLAAAQSLPDETPYRPQLVLIAFTVAITTLLLQGGTLPWIIKLTGIRGTDKAADRRELAELLDEIGEAGLEVLANPSLEVADGTTVDDEVVERVRHDTLLSAESAWERAEHGGGDEGMEHSPQKQYRTLRRQVLSAEREALLEARSAGSYSSRVLSRAQAILDTEETRLEQFDHPSGT